MNFWLEGELLRELLIFRLEVELLRETLDFWLEGGAAEGTAELSVGRGTV